MSNSKFKKGLSDPRGAVFYFQDKLERSASKLFFKNTAGFTNNIKGFMDSYKVKKINFDYNKTEKNLISEEFMNKGYVKIGSPYDPELIKQISSKFENYILDKKFSYVRAKSQDDVYSRGLYRGHELIPESVQLLNDEIINIIEQYYKTHFQVSKFSFWRNYFVPPEVNKEKELISSNWHCDASNTSWVKLFVYLTDVTEDDGPFNVQSKERTKKLMKMGYKNRSNYNLPQDVIENEKYVWKATGDVGTALMCNCNLGLHKAGIPEPGHYRDVIQFQFAPSNEPLSKDWYKTFVDPNEPIKSRSHHNEPVEDPNT